MTDAVGANPALASLVLAAATSATGSAAADNATVPAAEGSATPEAQQAGFSALLLGLQAPAQPGAATAAPAADALQAGTRLVDGAQADATAAATELTAAGLATTASGTPNALARPGGKEARSGSGGKDTGEDSPDSGTGLPPADGQGPLASVPAPDALLASAAAAQAAPAPPTTTADAPAPTAAAIGVTAATATGTPRQALPGRAEAPALAADTTVPAGDASIDHGAAATGTATPAALAADAPPGKDQDAELPADFRSRLEAALADGARNAGPAQDSGANPGAVAVAAAPSASPVGHTQAGASASADALLGGLPTLQPAGDREAWAQGLGDRLLMMADKGLQSATLRLQPEHLGPMEIKISVSEDGSAQVLFSAHHGQTRDALESAIPRLRDLFAEQGLNLSQANVDAGRSNSFAQRGFAGQAAAADGRGAEEPAATAGEEPTAWRVARSQDRRLDVMV